METGNVAKIKHLQLVSVYILKEKKSNWVGMLIISACIQCMCKSKIVIESFTFAGEKKGYWKGGYPQES